jgi:hypothetical protein
MSVIHSSELFAIFAQTEEVQETYFPELGKPVYVGEFDEEMQSTRYIALRVLAGESGASSVRGGDLGKICLEITALCWLIELGSCTFPWLVMHPKAVKTATVEQKLGVILPDLDTYEEVWSVLRRLCKEGCRLASFTDKPRPFKESFSSVITIPNDS